MKLNTPDLANATFHRTFPDAPWLSAPSDATPFITMECRAGGYLNAPLQTAIEACNLKRDVELRDLAKLGADPAATPQAIVQANQKVIRRDALDRLGAVLDTCVVSWDTNIVSDGAVIDPTAENLKALSRALEPNTAEAFLALTKFVNDLAAFIVDRDAASVGN